MANVRLLAVTTLLVTGVTSSDDLGDGLFTSNADLQDLLSTEAELVAQMRSYVREEEDRLERLKS